jgi:hypothetical protein
MHMSMTTSITDYMHMSMIKSWHLLWLVCILLWRRVVTVHSLCIVHIRKGSRAREHDGIHRHRHRKHPAVHVEERIDHLFRRTGDDRLVLLDFRGSCRQWRWLRAPAFRRCLILFYPARMSEMARVRFMRFGRLDVLGSPDGRFIPRPHLLLLLGSRHVNVTSVMRCFCGTAALYRRARPLSRYTGSFKRA